MFNALRCLDRQTAFLEQVDDSSGIDSPMESRHKEGQSVGEGTSGSKGVLETSPEDVSQTFGSDCNSVGTEYEAKECVLCRSKVAVSFQCFCLYHLCLLCFCFQLHYFFQL